MPPADDLVTQPTHNEVDLLRTRSAILRGSAAIAVAMAAGKAAGFARDVSLASIAGAGSLTDSFLLSMTVPDFVMNILYAGGLGATVVPLLARHPEGSDRRRSLTRSLVVVTAIVAIVVAFGISHAASAIIDTFAASASPEARTTAGFFLSITAWMLVFHLTSGALSEILNAESHFVPPALGTLIFNFVMIGGILVYGLVRSPAVLPIAAVLAAAIRLGALVPPALAPLGRSLRITAADARQALGAVTVVGAPAALTTGTVYLQTLVNQLFAIRVGPGDLSALTYASRFVEIPLAFVTTALSIAVFPILSRLEAEHRREEARSVLAFCFGLAMLATLPIAVLLFAQSEAIVFAAYGRGAFSSSSVAATAGALRLLALGIPAAGLLAVLNRLFYARSDRRMPLVAAAMGVATNVTAQFALAGLGLSGVILAGVLGVTCQTVALSTRAALLRLLPRMTTTTGIELARIFTSSVAAVVGFALSEAALATLSPAPRAAIAAVAAVGAFAGALRLIRSTSARDAATVLVAPGRSRAAGHRR